MLRDHASLGVKQIRDLGLGEPKRFFREPHVQRLPVFLPPTQQPKTAPQFVFLPPAAPAPVQPVVQPLPAREVTYDGLLLLLNRYGIEFKNATTTVQKQDIRSRAQKEAVAFVENARVTLAGTVSDIQNGSAGMKTLTVGNFAKPEYSKQPDKRMALVRSSGRVSVALSREEALAIKSGQKVWITGKPQVIPYGNGFDAAFDDLVNPSIVVWMFSGDYQALLTMRILDYTVSLEEKRSQTDPRVKKPYSLIVVPPKANP